MSGGWRVARPEALWLLLAALPLVWLHLRGLRRKRVVLPSLLLLDAGAAGVATPLRSGVRPRDVLGLALELAALCALALAAARPERGGSDGAARPVALVLDGTASTMAGGRFDAQRERAAALLRALPPHVPVTLLFAGGDVRVLAAATDSRGAVEAALAAARPVVCGAGSLGRAARAAAAGGAEVVVFTDGCDPEGPVLAAAGAATVVSVGTPLRNGALLTVEADGDGRRFHVRLRDVDGSRAEATLTAEGGAAPRLSVSRAPGDALAADDAVDLPPAATPSPPRIALLAAGGRPDPYLRAALDAASGLLDGPRSVALPAGTAVPAGIDACVVVAGQPPAGLPYLRFRAGEGGEAPSVLPGESHHPVLLGVDTAELVVTRGATLEPEPGDAILLDGPAGPLALAGRRGGRRAVEVGFLPAESTFPLGAAFPVFVRNALLWVTADGGTPVPPVLRAGAVVAFATPGVRGAVVLAGPHGPAGRAAATRRPVVAEGGRVRFRVPWPDAPEASLCTLEVDGREHAVFAAALLDEAESDLEPRLPPSPAGAGHVRRSGPPSPPRDGGAPLALLAVALLLAEGVLFRLRRRVAPAPRADSFPAVRAGP